MEQESVEQAPQVGGVGNIRTPVPPARQLAQHGEQVEDHIGGDQPPDFDRQDPHHKDLSAGEVPRTQHQHPHHSGRGPKHGGLQCSAQRQQQRRVAESPADRRRKIKPQELPTPVNGFDIGAEEEQPQHVEDNMLQRPDAVHERVGHQAPDLTPQEHGINAKLQPLFHRAEAPGSRRQQLGHEDGGRHQDERLADRSRAQPTPPAVSRFPIILAVVQTHFPDPRPAPTESRPGATHPSASHPVANLAPTSRW